MSRKDPLCPPSRPHRTVGTETFICVATVRVEVSVNGQEGELFGAMDDRAVVSVDAVNGFTTIPLMS